MEFNEELSLDMIGNFTSDADDNKDNNTKNPVVEEEGNLTVEGGDAFFDGKNLFSEGVDDVNTEGEEDKTTDDVDGTSPNLYSSIATALKTDGILNLLEDSDLENITDANAFASIIQKQVANMLDDKQKRINDALSNDVPKDVVSQYENTLNYLDSITDSAIEDESDTGVQLRGNILVQDYINKGFSPERANREASKSIDAGTDIEDAQLAIKELKDFYTKGYNSTLEEAKKNKDALRAKEKEISDKIEKRFTDTEEPIKGVKLDKSTRTKMLKQYTTFVDKDEAGKPINAIGKYAKENPVEYQYMINALFYLTDGFKNLETVVKAEVNKEKKSALSQLEATLTNPNNRVGTGGLSFNNDKSIDSFEGFHIKI